MLVETILRITPCSVLRPTLSGWTPGPSCSSSFGKSIGLDLDLAGAHVGDTSVVRHVVSLCWLPTNGPFAAVRAGNGTVGERTPAWLTRQVAGALGHVARELGQLEEHRRLARRVVAPGHAAVLACARGRRRPTGGPGARRSCALAGLPRSRSVSRAVMSCALVMSTSGLPLHEARPSSVTRSVSRAPGTSPLRVTRKRSRASLPQRADRQRRERRERGRRGAASRSHRGAAAPRVAGARERAGGAVALDGLHAAEEQVAVAEGERPRGRRRAARRRRCPARRRRRRPRSARAARAPRRGPAGRGRPRRR